MPAQRDMDILAHILRYCEQVHTAHMDFSSSRDTFFHSTTYQNAICMCILQIGELVGKLTESFRAENEQIPWRKIRGMRNFVAHEYGHLDLEIVWYAATVSIPELQAFCEKELENCRSSK